MFSKMHQERGCIGRPMGLGEAIGLEVRLEGVIGLEWAIGLRASLVVQMVKSLTTMQETWVRSLCWEDPLEMERETYSSIVA